ncbi:MAG: carbon-nitrogen hydrolase family protein [Geminicoccaceae bacterium]|nr:carbon-nitrogen hydrolase family protein [Geminicoccaceae bacterium]
MSFMFAMSVDFSGEPPLRIALATRSGATLDALMVAAASKNVRLLVLPELWLDAEGGIESDEERIDGLAVAAQRHGLALLFGYRERCRTGVFSAAQIIDDRGYSLSNTRCAHPTPPPDTSADGPSLDAGNWMTVSHGLEMPMSILLGDDVLFPEVTRAVTLKGAALVLALRRSPLADPRLEEALLRVRAYENAITAIGLLDGRVYAFAPDAGRIAAQSGPCELVMIDVPSISLAKPPRRPELYQQLVASGEGDD